VIGGLPSGGWDFGTGVNAQAILDQPAQFDFYDGSGLDTAFLGMAEADRQGNVNVSRFGPRMAGSGGFINISQNAKRLVFLGTFTAGGRPHVDSGRLVVEDGSAHAKFVTEVEQRTFSGPLAAAAGKQVLYVTERCVFQLTTEGIELIEVAPGVDLQADVLAQMDFEPVIQRAPEVMDARLFRPEAMGLKDELLAVPLEARFAFDPEANLFFLNLEGMSVTTAEQAEAITTEIDKRLAAVGKEVRLVVNYDNFSVAPELHDTYIGAVRGLTERYYTDVTRYTTSAFMRLKLGEMLSSRGVAPHIYESRQEAVNWHRKPEKSVR
jgi:propionate CoA-transferase